MKEDKKTPSISFALRNITTEQFALIEDAEVNDSKVKVESNLRFGANKNEKLISTFANFSFNTNDNPFIIIEVGCHFIIKDDSWRDLLDEDSLLLKCPKGFIRHLVVLTVGTVRGVLHAKTEDTNYNKFFLPTINVTEMIKEDVVFNLKETSSTK